MPNREKRKKYMREYMRAYKGRRIGIRQKPQKASDPVPETLSQIYFGDPMPGRSALDQMKAKKR